MRISKLEQKGLEYAASKGLGITIMKPLRGGKLAANLPEEALNVFDKANIKKNACRSGFKLGLEPSRSISYIKRNECNDSNCRKYKNGE